MFLYGMLTLVFTLFIFIKPRVAFYLVLGSLMTFFEPLSQVVLFTVGKSNVYGCDLIMISLFFYLVCGLLMHQRFPWYPASVRWFSALFLWGVLGIARGIPRYGYRAVGEARWYVIMPILCYYFVLMNFKSKRQIRDLVQTGLWLLLFALAFRFVDYYLLGGMGRLEWWALEDPRARFRFIGANTNLLVAWALILLILFYVFGAIKKSQFLFYAGFGLLSTVIIVPQTRSVWLAAAVGIAIVMTFIGSHFARRGLPLQGVFLAHIVLLIAILLPLVASLVGGELVNKIIQSASFIKNPTNDPTGYWRLLGWQQELEKAMQQPFLGQGLGGYSEWFDGQTWQQVAVHNGYIMHFSKFGISGLAVLFVALASWYKEVTKYIRLEKGRYYKLLASGFQICVFMNLVFAFFYDFTIFFWIVVAIGTALVRAHQYDESLAGPPYATQSRRIYEH